MPVERKEGLREASRRVLDDAARQRRQKQALEILEKDNHIEESQIDSSTPKKPKFDDETKRGRKRKRGLTNKAKTRKTFEILLDEAFKETKGGQLTPSYFSAAAPASRMPRRKFCDVCGFHSKYACVTCGVRYCCIKCKDVHLDTRCMKWLA